MKMSETTLSFLERDCIELFGEQDGKKLFQKTEEIYQDLICHADDRSSEMIRDHLRRKLFPPMAYYQALCSQRMSLESALSYVRRETRKAAEVKREEMQKLAKLPFAYTIYRMRVKSHMKKNFPDEGWTTEWVRCDHREIHFNLRQCIYWELTQQYGCPELCCVYCENDEVSFAGLLPKIRFERTGTLGSGSSCCDFHFIRV